MRDFNNTSNQTQLGNRNDFCYLCAKDIKADNEDDYHRQLKALKGAIEGKQTVKISRSGTSICLCLPCIHKIADENPIKKEDK